MYKRHTPEEGLKVFEMHKAEYGSASISRFLGIDLSEVKRRCRDNDLTGSPYQARKRNVHATPELRKRKMEPLTKATKSH